MAIGRIVTDSSETLGEATNEVGAMESWSGVGAVIVASGRSRRMGRAKDSVQLAGKSLLAHCLGSLEGAEERVVVVRPGRARALATANFMQGARLLENPAPERGMLSSVATGLMSLRSPWGLILPVDCPLVRPETIGLLAASRNGTGGNGAVIPVHHGRDGHPVLLGPDLCEEVIEAVLVGADTHLEEILLRRGEAVLRVEVGDSSVLDNINTASALARVQERLEGVQ